MRECEEGKRRGRTTCHKGSAKGWRINPPTGCSLNNSLGPDQKLKTPCCTKCYYSWRTESQACKPAPARPSRVSPVKEVLDSAPRGKGSPVTREDKISMLQSFDLFDSLYCENEALCRTLADWAAGREGGGGGGSVIAAPVGRLETAVFLAAHDTPWSTITVKRVVK